MMRRLAWTVLAVTLTVWIVLEVINAAGGGRIQSFWLEYAGGGSLKWRSADGFQWLLIGASLWTYPATLVSTVLFAWSLRRSSRADFLKALAGIALSLVVLARFLQLSVLSAAIGIRL
jgi:hypothetical protein